MNETNQRLVASVAKLFENQGLSHEELIAAGNRGLRKAEEHYSPNAHFSFVAYAVWWIRQRILDALNIQKSENKSKNTSI